MSAAHARPEAGAAEPWAGIDLNLLVAFDTLARERSVTRAAERTGVTQSAMSHTLKRLRELLGDPLLVRGRSGLVLTPLAESLVVPLRSGLVTLRRALAQPSEFAPSSARRSFCLASPDLFDVLAIPPLLERVRRQAPGVDLSVVPGGGGISAALETGEVDVAIAAQVDQLEAEPMAASWPGLVRRTLFRDRFVCLIRADHPAIARTGRARRSAQRALTLETYVALSHALVSPAGAGPGLVDQVLDRHGLRRRIALRIPHFYSALAIVARSDLILTAPSALAALASRDLQLVALPPPLALPEHAIQMIWHERFSNDPGHHWLRDLVAEVAREAHATAGKRRGRGDGRRAGTRPGRLPAAAAERHLVVDPRRGRR